LYIKLSKCSFYQMKIHYLGHIILGEGIIVEPMNVEDIMECPTLKMYKNYVVLWDYKVTIDASSKVFQKNSKSNYETAKEE
jgi:hypothetical protein